MLLRGEAIPENLAAQVVIDKVNSPQVNHHGMTKAYFLCVNKNTYFLVLTDKCIILVLSIHLLVVILSEQLIFTTSIFQFVLVVALYLNFVFAISSGYVLDDFPTISEENMSIKDQIELVKSWKLKPDFIIHLKVCCRSQTKSPESCLILLKKLEHAF